MSFFSLPGMTGETHLIFIIWVKKEPFMEVSYEPLFLYQILVSVRI